MAGRSRQELAQRGIALPTPPTPQGAYTPVVSVGNLAWVSGMLPFREGKLTAEGRVDSEVDVARGQEAARWAALNGVAALEASLGDLDRVARVVRVGVFVASSPDFVRQPEVANGASQVLQEVFGEAGVHARAAVASPRLPRNAPVEVELLVALR